MALEFIGIDPNTGQSGSPTAWVDTETADIVLQSYTADDATRAQCIENTAPGHAKGIPAHGADPALELWTEPAVVKQCVDAFSAVWSRATPHELYEIR
ncbi:hypothetical protein ACFT38_43595 [Streptomyces sp. NPDC056975]|uniref:hypothetical protein n=1 Tax=Streptomyces sp. NPDC056975 TaxID=3345985 RepID=UPI003642DDC5